MGDTPAMPDPVDEFCVDESTRALLDNIDLVAAQMSLPTRVQPPPDATRLVLNPETDYSWQRVAGIVQSIGESVGVEIPMPADPPDFYTYDEIAALIRQHVHVIDTGPRGPVVDPSDIPSTREGWDTAPRVSYRVDDLLDDSDPTVALNIITRNGMDTDRGRHIVRAIKSAAPIITELVVVDTGSTDDTVEQVRNLEAWLGFAPTIIELPAVDPDAFHFGDTRNVALDASTADYVVWMDDDEEFTRQAIATLMGEIGKPTGSAVGLCVYGFNIAMPTPRVSMFPRLPGVRWRFAVHEQIDTADYDGRIPTHPHASGVWHWGYVSSDAVDASWERNRRIAEHRGEDPIADGRQAPPIRKIDVLADVDGFGA